MTESVIIAAIVAIATVIVVGIIAGTTYFVVVKNADIDPDINDKILEEIKQLNSKISKGILTGSMR